MPAPCIQYVLRNDTLDVPASAIYNLTPAAFVGGVSSVPAYLYSSLKTLVVGATGDLTTFQNQIVADLGTGQDSPKGSIVIGTRSLTEQVLSRKLSIRADQPGATVSPIWIQVYKPRIQLQTLPLNNIVWRIQYLLDNTLRGVRGRPSAQSGGSLPKSAILQDPSIDSRFGIFCFYEDIGEPINPQENALLFWVDYIRLFTASPLINPNT